MVTSQNWQPLKTKLQMLTTTWHENNSQIKKVEKIMQMLINCVDCLYFLGANKVVSWRKNLTFWYMCLFFVKHYYGFISITQMHTPQEAVNLCQSNSQVVFWVTLILDLSIISLRSQTKHWLKERGGKKITEQTDGWCVNSWRNVKQTLTKQRRVLQTLNEYQ